MLNNHNTTELIISSVLFLFIMGFTRSFLLSNEINTQTILYDTLFFFIWYGIFLNLE